MRRALQLPSCTLNAAGACVFWLYKMRGMIGDTWLPHRAEGIVAELPTRSATAPHPGWPALRVVDVRLARVHPF